MSNIQKTLDSLQPYVISIRYVEGVAVVDTVFKDGWTLPESDKIKRVKGDEGLNYHMIFSEVEGVGLDDLLDYVGLTIKLNQEREKKHELLKVKVGDLKELFKKTPLDKLVKLKFVLTDELSTNITDIDLDETPVSEVKPIEPPQPVITEESPTTKLTQYLDADKNPIPLSEEDMEAAEEEARAQAFLKAKRLKELNGDVKKFKIELPPKRQQEQHKTPVLANAECDCGPTEACSKCIENKDL